MAPVVGVDVSRDTLDICVRPSQQGRRIPNTAKGHRALIKQFQLLQPYRIVVEGSGGLERRLVRALQGVGLPVVVSNPRQVRDFAKGTGHLAKTDPIDAQVLAHFAEVVPLPVPVPRTANECVLQGLVERRRQLIQIHKAELCRRDRAGEWASGSIDRILTLLDHEMAHIAALLSDLIASDPELNRKAAVIRSVPGIGPVLTASLLADLPELGQLSAKQIAALVGVAPFTHQSGLFTGQAHIRGGRAALRAALFVATISAKRFNPVIRGFANRLTAAHKPSKVTTIACERKLLTILNAMVRDGAMWNPEVTMS